MIFRRENINHFAHICVWSQEKQWIKNLLVFDILVDTAELNANYNDTKGRSQEKHKFILT